MNATITTAVVNRDAPTLEAAMNALAQFPVLKALYERVTGASVSDFIITSSLPPFSALNRSCSILPVFCFIVLVIAVN